MDPMHRWALETSYHAFENGQQSFHLPTPHTLSNKVLNYTLTQPVCQSTASKAPGQPFSVPP